RGQEVVELIEHERACLLGREPATGHGEIFNKDVLLWIGLPFSPLGSEASSMEPELFEFRRSVRVDLLGGQSVSGEVLYSAPAESTRLVDDVNAPGRFVRLWTKDFLYLMSKAFVLRLVE